MDVVPGCTGVHLQLMRSNLDLVIEPSTTPSHTCSSQKGPNKAPDNPYLSLFGAGGSMAGGSIGLYDMELVSSLTAPCKVYLGLHDCRPQRTSEGLVT